MREWHGHRFVSSWFREVPGTVCIAANHSERDVRGKVSGVWLSFVPHDHPCYVALMESLAHDRAREEFARMKAMPGPKVPAVLYR